MARPTQLHINIDALQHNFKRVQESAPNAAILAVVKANAYGHGAVKIAQHLPQAAGFAVACIEEALILRKANIQQPIILLEGFFQAAELNEIVQQNLEIVVHHFEQIAALEKFTTSRPIKVWLKINTGMYRLGFLPQAAQEAYQRLQACKAIAPGIRLMSHFATADETENANTKKQMELFNFITNAWSEKRSLANSAGVIAWPDSHCDLVRAGLVLYGIFPLKNKTAADLNLKPVMTVSSQIIALQDVPKGDKVGYRGEWICPADRRIGIVAMGYGDGYPCHAKTGTPVLVNNQIAPLIGRVSMDMLMVDLHTQPHAKIGDPVILWGDGLPVETVALHAGTIPYELVCKITERVKRD